MPEKSKFSFNKSSSVLFVTFSRWDGDVRSPTTGSLDPLRDFLVPKIRKLTIIDQVHPSGDGVMPIIEEYKNQKIKGKQYNSSWWMYILKPWLSLPHTNPNGTYVRFKIRDFLSVIDWSLREKAPYDYCICLESINTLAAILLKKIGRVKCVVYYVSDYSPNRYPQKWFNNLYLALDRFCATHADFIWDVSPAMQKARISEGGLNSAKSAPVIHVPNGLHPGQIKAEPISKIDKQALVYMGTVGAENGPDVAIKSLAIVKKSFPKANLHLVGGTEKDLVWLRKIAKKLGIEKSVKFHGFVKDGFEMSKIIRRCAVGLAPYRAIPGSIRYYADAGKIRNYCAAGLPTVSSQVPPLGLFVAEKGAAVIAKDDAQSFAKAIIDIFKNKRVYERLRRNAIILARNNTWENSFNNAFKIMSK